MALIRHIKPSDRASKRSHSEVEATFCIVRDDEEGKCLQIDTYGSASRQDTGKVSQSIRLSPAALAELKQIIAEHFGDA
jgi:hypothetical protein